MKNMDNPLAGSDTYDLLAEPKTESRMSYPVYEQRQYSCDCGWVLQEIMPDHIAACQNAQCDRHGIMLALPPVPIRRCEAK